MISFSKKYNKSIFTLVIFLIGLSSWSQNILISQGGTVNVSGGEIFYDAGGAAGNDGNTNYTITLCPSNPGEKVCVNFSYFKTYFSGSGEDALLIYDGNTVTPGTDIGKLMGDYSIDVSNATTPYGAGIEPDGTLSAVYSPTIFCATSSTGCLTLTFVNGNASQQPGWVANVTTYKDLPAPGCNIDITSDKTSICNGENVQLTVTGDIVAAAINNNFNGSLGTGWQGTASATIVNTVCAAPSLDNSQYLWMQSSPGPRSLTSNSFNLANGGTISFEHRQAKFNSDPSPCEAPDINFSGTRNEGIYLQYSTDNGTNWTTFKFLFSNSQFSNSGTADSYNNGCGDYVHRWTKMTYPIPDAAKTPNTLFRWHQQRVTSASTDNWGLDNVVIASPLASTVTVRNLTTGGIVIGTSTTTPYTLNVTPTVTTTYEVTISNGVTSCTDQVTVTVGAGIAANAGVDINQCNNASFTMAANTPIAPTTGSWSVISGSVSPATSSNPNQVFVLTGTTATLRWNFDGVCDSLDDVIISNNSLLPAPSVGAVTQPTCATATGSFQITGYNAANTYTFTPSVVSISGTGLVTANAGTYTFTVTNASGCISSASANIVVNAQPTTPAAPTVGAVTQPTCATATGSFQITGYNAANTYTFTPSVVSISGTGLVTANAGTYTFTVTNASGCISSASANIVVNAQPTPPAAPTVGAVTQPTCATATGSFQITGYNAANTYTFTPSVVSISGTGLVTANAGTYTFTVTNASGCISSASANIVVNAQPTPPAAPTVGAVTQPTCATATGSFQITGYNAANTYTFTPSVVSISGTGLVTANAGTYTFTVTNASGCISSASANIVVNAQPTPPATPTVGAVTQPTCATATGSFQITGYNAANTYTFTPSVVSISGTGLVTANAGTYTFTVTNASGCISSASANIVVNAQPTPPAAPTVGAVTQPTCATATGSFQITGYNAANTYTFTPSVVSISGTGLVTANAGTYTFTVTNASGCISSASANIVVNAQPTTPAAPTVGAVTQPTCATATGSFQITGYNAANTYIFTPSVVSISGAGLVTANAGTYTFTVTNASGCISSESANIVVNAQPTPPAAPTVGAVTQPTCATATGSFQITGYNAANTYTFTPSVVSISGTGLVTANAGTYTFTVTNASGCISSASANIVVNAQPTPPATPTVGAVTQPTCATATGSFQITGYNAANTYTFTPSVVSISGAGLVTANAGTYTFTVTNASGCISSASANIVVNAQPTTPAAPIITSTPASCSTNGSSMISNYFSGVNYVFNPSGPIVLSDGLISGMVLNTNYIVSASNGTCTSLSSVTFSNASLAIPRVISTNLNPTFCSGGTTNIQLTSNVPGATFSWTVTGGNVVGALGGSGTSINQLLTVSAGTTSTVEVVYTIIAEANGCAGPPQVVRVQVNPIPDLTVASSTAPICSGETTNISFTGTIPGAVFSWVVMNVTGVAGASNGTGTSIQQVLTTTGLSQGSVTYQITPTFNGCTGTPQSVTVLVNPRPELFADPTHPPLCSGEDTFIIVSSFNPNTTLDWTVNPVGVDGALSGTATGSTTIEQVLTTSGNAQGYVDYTITPTLAGCSGTPIVVRVYVNPLPLPTLNDGAICVDEFGATFQTYTLNSGLDNATYDFVWYLDGVAIPNSNNATYTANTVGTYSVIATNSITNCVSEIVSANITATTPATSFTVTQSEYFTGNAVLTVNVTGGSGTLMYSLDEGTLQSSNVFTNVSAGPHTITVVDTQGCTYLVQTVFVINYPQYFTPNGDGNNDTWFITGLQDTDVIFIFDRYGKLIKQLRGQEGWDGTYNQELLPSTDYWFTVDYTENAVAKQFKAHFSLIR